MEGRQESMKFFSVGVRNTGNRDCYGARHERHLRFYLATSLFPPGNIHLRKGYDLRSVKPITREEAESAEGFPLFRELESADNLNERIIPLGALQAQ